MPVNATKFAPRPKPDDLHAGDVLEQWDCTLSVREVAERLGVNVTTVYRWMDRRTVGEPLPYLQAGRRRRVRRSDLAAFIQGSVATGRREGDTPASSDPPPPDAEERELIAGGW